MKTGVVHLHHVDECGNDGQGGEGRRADGEALTDGGRGVAHFVEGVGNGTGFFTHSRHLSDAARVVRDRTISIDTHSDPDRREHADRRDTDPVKAGKMACPENDKGHHGERDNHGEHPDGEAADHHGGHPGQGRLGNGLHRRAAGVVLG